MKIETEFDPYAPAAVAWTAIDRDSYDGNPNQVGAAESPKAAEADLKRRRDEADEGDADDDVRDERAALMDQLGLREGDFR